MKQVLGAALAVVLCAGMFCSAQTAERVSVIGSAVRAEGVSVQQQSKQLPQNLLAHEDPTGRPYQHPHA